MKRVQFIGSGPAEVKIYPLKRKHGGYRSYQIAWYEFGQRQTKTISDLNRAKIYAQEVHVSLIGTDRRTEITMRDAEALCTKFGVSLPFAIREWADARTMLGGASLIGNARSLADALHGIEEIGVRDAVKKFIARSAHAGHRCRSVWVTPEAATEWFANIGDLGPINDPFEEC